MCHLLLIHTVWISEVHEPEKRQPVIQFLVPVCWNQWPGETLDRHVTFHNTDLSLVYIFSSFGILPYGAMPLPTLHQCESRGLVHNALERDLLEEGRKGECEGGVASPAILSTTLWVKKWDSHWKAIGMVSFSTVSRCCRVLTLSNLSQGWPSYWRYERENKDHHVGEGKEWEWVGSAALSSLSSLLKGICGSRDCFLRGPTFSLGKWGTVTKQKKISGSLHYATQSWEWWRVLKPPVLSLASAIVSTLLLLLWYHTQTGRKKHSTQWLSMVVMSC